MDINSLLPLLLGKDGNADKAKLFSMMTGNKNPEDMVASMAGPEMSGILNMLKNNKKSRGDNASGLGVITSFAPADIIGTLVKLLNAG